MAKVTAQRRERFEARVPQGMAAGLSEANIQQVRDLMESGASSSRLKNEARMLLQTGPATAALSASTAAQQGFFEFSQALAEEQAAQSRELFNVFKKDFLPGIQRFAGEAFAGIPADQAVGRAVGSVERQLGLSRRAGDRQMASLGIDPSSPRALGARAQQGLTGAALRADAANQTRSQVRETNFARRGQASQLGMNLPGMASGSAQTGAGIFGAGAQGLSNALGAQAQQQLGILQAQQALSQAHRDRQQQRDSMLSGAAGQLGGMALGSFAGPMGTALGGMFGRMFGGGGGGSTLGATTAANADMLAASDQSFTNRLNTAGTLPPTQYMTF